MPVERTEEEMNEIPPGYCAMLTKDVNFEVEQIIYRQIIINPNNYDASIYKNTFVPRKYNDGQPFRSLLRGIAKYGYSSHKPEDRPEHHPLDIAVYLNSIIIVQLPPLGRYRFIEPAVLLKKDDRGQCPTDLYGQLRYVDEEGDPDKHPSNHCTMIYFRAKFQERPDNPPYIQPFLYNIPPLPVRFTVVDPDVRYPGNGSSPPES